LNVASVIMASLLVNPKPKSSIASIAEPHRL
jgi:hypothetical protein